MSTDEIRQAAQDAWKQSHVDLRLTPREALLLCDIVEAVRSEHPVHAKGCHMCEMLALAGEVVNSSGGAA